MIFAVRSIQSIWVGPLFVVALARATRPAVRPPSRSNQTTALARAFRSSFADLAEASMPRSIVTRAGVSNNNEHCRRRREVRRLGRMLWKAER